MLENFTDKSLRTVVLAEKQARMLGHDYIGTEHLLLGLIREDPGPVIQVLAALAGDPNRIRQQVIRLLHGQQGQAGPA
jgi:ATP-dependent Clp protease ATP-binding subunit ClpC